MLKSEIQLLFSGLSQSKVLILDDDEIMLAILADLLSDLVEYRCLQNGAELLKTVELYQPDLILLDVHMPNIDGLTLCRALKDNEKTQGIPVIFITGLDSEEQENACW